MERRLLLVFALTFLVIILFQPLLKKYFPQSAGPGSRNPGRGAACRTIGCGGASGVSSCCGRQQAGLGRS